MLLLWDDGLVTAHLWLRWGKKVVLHPIWGEAPSEGAAIALSITLLANKWLGITTGNKLSRTWNFDSDVTVISAITTEAVFCRIIQVAAFRNGLFGRLLKIAISYCCRAGDIWITLKASICQTVYVMRAGRHSLIHCKSITAYEPILLSLRNRKFIGGEYQ